MHSKLHVHAFAALLFTTATALAQTSAPVENSSSSSTTSMAATSVASPNPLPILSVALPPNARLRIDVDARDEEVLGVVKSVLRGFKGQSLKELLASANVGRTKTAGDASPNDASRSNEVNLASSAAIQFFSDADMETVLRNVNHLRAVYFQTPYPRRNYSPSGAPKTDRLAAPSVVSFYEQAYVAREGGHRIARMDFDDVQMLAVGFPNNGFAMVFQSPGMGFVVRADGYPDFEGVGPFVMGMILMRMAPMMR